MIESMETINKGKVIWAYELEDSDTEEIKKQLLNAQGEYDYYETAATIELTGDTTGNLVEFDVTVSDYLTEKEWVHSIDLGYMVKTLRDQYEDTNKDKYNFYKGLNCVIGLSPEDLTQSDLDLIREDFMAIKF